MTTRMGLLVVLAVAGCGAPSRQSHTLSLDFTFADGGTGSLRLDGPAGFSAAPGTSRIRASWPFAEPNMQADRFLTDFTPWRLGTQVANTAEATVGGRQVGVLNGASLQLHVDRIQWNATAHFPWTHHGRVSGSIEGATVSGQFTISESGDCANVLTRGSAQTCGSLWPVDFEAGAPRGPMTFQLPAQLLTDTCPATLRDQLLQGTTVTLSQTQFQAGTALAVPCAVTDLPAPVTHGSKKVVTSRRACGLTTVLSADGCRWATTVNVFDQLQFVITAAVVDGSCAPQSCGITSPKLEPTR